MSDKIPRWHIDYAEELMDEARLNNLAPSTRESQSREALVHAVIAIAKMIGRGRA